MKQTDIQKALIIKNLLDSGNITIKEANQMMNNQFIILGGFYDKKEYDRKYREQKKLDINLKRKQKYLETHPKKQKQKETITEKINRLRIESGIII